MSSNGELLKRVKEVNTRLIERTKRNLKEEDIQRNIELQESIEVSFNSLKKDIDEKMLEAINVEILSSKGNIFLNNQIDTTLEARIYSGMNEITELIPETYFKWIRISGDESGDKIWNEKHKTGSRTLHVTSADVINKATFQLNVEIINDYLKDIFTKKEF